MERPLLARAVAGGVALALLFAPLATRAATGKGSDAKADKSAAPLVNAKPPVTASPTASAPTTTSAAPLSPPADAEAALERVRAAYEYGEMEMVVDAARLVAEGRLHPTPAERASALRYLGIGLYLTDRQEGAETAFFDLLRLRPRTRLDATTTRPDVVAFFDDVRRRHAIEINAADKDRPGKSLALALLPPAGQFQAGHKARGITLAAVEGLSLVGAIGTYAQLKAWRRPDDTFGPPPGQTGTDHTSAAETLLALNKVSIIVLVATVAVGIVDGVASYFAVEPEDTGASVADVFGRGYRF
ncbi:MAG TPA: hypothetical protein VLA14_10025 [Polyangia bacterium]|nr:hypothetical protein [Polyangia bacterium]